MEESMRIGDFDTGRRVLIVAEIGNNHEGDPVLAREMVNAAAEAGADAVKFQTIVPERLVSALQTERIAQLARLSLPLDQFADLAQAARARGVLFLSTPFDLDSVDFLNPLVPAFKVSSPDNTFHPLLAAVAATGKPVLLSAGLCRDEELRTSVDYLRRQWKLAGASGELALLHCVSSYPTPPGQAGLRAIGGLARFGAEPGYSDHTLGIEAAVLSVAAGARIVEKHFTLDKTRPGFRDHQLSADPVDLARMVLRIRQAEEMLGSDSICCAPCEEQGRVAYRRSVVAARDLPRGTTLAAPDLDWVRPGGGIAPGGEEVLLGKCLREAKKRGEMILAGDVR
jgi:N-acetylneuraminate synthase/N,N'-diacetyllegionaminate synthase